MAGRGKKAAAPKKKANGYKMPAPISVGEVIHDTIGKKKWRLGPSIGVGGFGEIYSACEHENSPKKGSSYPFVVKIEPHENGPLFVEKHFYIRNANKDDITKFMKTKNLSSLGMPLYFGNGSHDYKGEKYRYLVLERYGKDVWHLFQDAGRSFRPGTVFQIGLQMLDVLEYIHSRGYVHADIKGANILMGMKKGTENQAYLVDFGLASRVNEREFKPDPKSAHNGTIEYTSRDAHLGVPTMRGDLEILAYNMLQWLIGELPWEKSLNQPKTVQTLKEDFMKNVRSRISKDYPNVPDALIKFFEYINSMEPKDIPDYSKCRQIIENYLKTLNKTRTSKIDFSPNKAKTKGKSDSMNLSKDVTNGDTPKKRARKAKTKALSDSDNENEEPEDSQDDKIKENKPIKNRKVLKRGRKVKAKGDSDNENEEPEDSQDDENYQNKPVKNRKSPKKRGGKPKAKVVSDSENEELEDSQDDENDQNKPVKNGNILKKNGRQPRTKASDSDNEVVQLEDSQDEETKVPKQNKRKSSEPSFVQVKKTKLSPKATPPVKKNHANMATQTSVDKRRSPRQVSFDSPICEIIGDKKPTKNNSPNTSTDIFEDSFVEEKKVKPKRKLLSKEVVTKKRVVKKKVTTVKKDKSWKDTPAILNGRSPPK